MVGRGGKWGGEGESLWDGGLSGTIWIGWKIVMK